MDDSLLQRLREHARLASSDADSAHDYGHVSRVAANAEHLAREEGARVDVVLAAAWLHELFSYPKGHPDSHLSGEVCAERAGAVLRSEGVSEDLNAAACECIRVHAFSRGLVPTSLEGKVLQDADRLDAIGAIGIARCFATCASMGRPLYSPEDPFCTRREPQDKLWGVDHFYKKLLRIAEGLHTGTAREMGRDRTEFLRVYLRQLESEIAVGG